MVTMMMMMIVMMMFLSPGAVDDDLMHAGRGTAGGVVSVWHGVVTVMMMIMIMVKMIFT